tara:strand:+ start:345 stop:1145 length:801 start_codon:yes stop_codon:yes gene_type:complete
VNNIQTSCENCVFAKYTSGIQDGCQLDRDKKLGVSETTEDGFFHLERFCNTYRPEEWLNDLNLEESMDLEDTVIKEVMPIIGFFVRLSPDHNDYAIDKLRVTIESIAQIENGPPAYIAVINDRVEFNEEIWAMFLEYFEHPITKYHIVQVRTKLQTAMKNLDEAFSHAQNGWLYSTTSGETVPKDILPKINKFLNIDMMQLTMVEPYDDYNGLIFPPFIFKFLKGNKTKIFQDEMMDSRPFITKMKAAEERGKTKTILSWEEFNAS